MAQTHLLLTHAGTQSESLVQELRSQNGMSAGDSIVGGQIVVLTGIDDNAGITIDDTREVLVNDGTLHVDVTEQDAVQRVVQHNIQTLQSAHSGDLGHAQTRAVVAQTDVTLLFSANFVQSSTHQAEVLLSSVGTAEALGGSAVRHIVQQGLTGGTDNSDDISALLGTSLSLDNILVDVTGSNDDVQIGAGLIAELLQELVTGSHVVVDTLQSGVNNGHNSGTHFFSGVHGDLGQVDFAGSDLLGNSLRINAVLSHSITDIESGAAGQNAFFKQMVNNNVGQGHVDIIHAVDAEQAANRPLDSNGSMSVDELLDVISDLGSAGTSLLDQLHVQIQSRFHTSPFLNRKSD